MLNASGKHNILSICYYFFLRIASNQNSENTNNYYAISVSLDMGKAIINRYLRFLKAKLEKNSKYSDWLKNWAKDNNTLYSFNSDDEFISLLGFKLIDLLNYTGLISKKLEQLAKDNKQWLLLVKDNILVDY